MGSRETVVWASAPERKYPFMVTFSPESAVVRYHAMYREAAKTHGYAASGSQLGWATPIYVADTDERAREEAKAGIESLFNNFLPMPYEMLLPPGYTSNASMKATIKMRPALGAWPRKQSDRRTHCQRHRRDRQSGNGTRKDRARPRTDRLRDPDHVIAIRRAAGSPRAPQYGAVRRRGYAEAAVSCL